MLRRGMLVALAIAGVLACAAPARAGVTLDMSWGSPYTDTYQVIPLGPESVAWAGGYSWVRKVLAPDGTLWSTGVDSSAPMLRGSTALPALPSGLVPGNWAVGADGRLWFTEIRIGGPGSGDTPTPDLIGRIDPATNAVVEYGDLTPGAQARTIAAGADGNIWFVEYGTRSIGRITPTGGVTEFPLPAGVVPVAGRGQELATGPDNDLYFVVEGGIGRMTLAGTFMGVTNGGVADFAPNAVAYGHDGNLWATECGANTLVRISPRTGKGTRLPEGSIPPRACPMGLVADPAGRLWFYEWNTSRGGRLLFDDPLARTDDPTAVSWDAADLNGSANPRGAATAAHFEYGTTAAYGSATPDQAIGDDDGAVDVSAHLAGLQPLTTYHYRLVASSVIGTVHGFDATLTTGPKPPPPPPPPPVDRDGDGFFAAVDCDDLSTAIHPGAVDQPGDRIDQDCNGKDAPYAQFAPHPNAVWKVVHGRIVFTRLTVDALPAGAAVKLTCAGTGCPKQGYTATIASPTKRLDVAKRLKDAKLHKGARVELTLSRPGYITTIVRWTIGKAPVATTLCRPPGAKKAKAC